MRSSTLRLGLEELRPEGSLPFESLKAPESSDAHSCEKKVH
jgi:hypothetical protein